MQTKMLMNNLFMTLFAVFAALFTSVAAAPAALQVRDVYDPPVLTPGTGTVWHTGELQNVTWFVPYFLPIYIHLQYSLERLG